MAEIRSTLDLIMERTKGMTMSPQEKEELRQEELAKRARGFQVKLLDNPDHAKEILSPLESMGEEERAGLERLLWQGLVHDLPTDRDALKYVAILRRLSPAATKQRVLDKIESDLKSIAKAHGAEEKKALARERKRLEAFGISGSAVIPKLSGRSATGESQRLAEDMKRRLLDGV
ncbi:MAG: hypothetical protein AB1646_23735 [Thermodesulfobacteriota bacterium]